MKGQPQRLNSAPRGRGLNELSSVRITDQWALTDLSRPVTRLGSTKLRRPPCSVCVWYGTSFKRTSKEEIVGDVRTLVRGKDKQKAIKAQIRLTRHTVQQSYKFTASCTAWHWSNKPGYNMKFAVGSLHEGKWKWSRSLQQMMPKNETSSARFSSVG